MAGEKNTQFRRTTRQEITYATPRAKPDRYSRGEVLKARKLNQIVDGVNTRAGTPPPAQENSLRQRTTGIYEARLVRELGDFLECELFEGSANPERILVAKPFVLRRTANDARGTVTYTYSDAYPDRRVATFADAFTFDATFLQWITPGYVPRGHDGHPGDVIYVSNQIVGDVGIFRTGITGGQPEQWIDLNVDGRQWASEIPSQPSDNGFSSGYEPIFEPIEV